MSDANKIVAVLLLFRLLLCDACEVKCRNIVNAFFLSGCRFEGHEKICVLNSNICLRSRFVKFVDALPSEKLLDVRGCSDVIILEFLHTVNKPTCDSLLTGPQQIVELVGLRTCHGITNTTYPTPTSLTGWLSAVDSTNEPTTAVAAAVEKHTNSSAPAAASYSETDEALTPTSLSTGLLSTNEPTTAVAAAVEKHTNSSTPATASYSETNEAPTPTSLSTGWLSTNEPTTAVAAAVEKHTNSSPPATASYSETDEAPKTTMANTRAEGNNVILILKITSGGIIIIIIIIVIIVAIRRAEPVMGAGTEIPIQDITIDSSNITHETSFMSSGEANITHETSFSSSGEADITHETSFSSSDEAEAEEPSVVEVIPEEESPMPSPIATRTRSRLAVSS